MVQRKTSHDRLGQEHGRSLEPEMMKRPRHSKPTTLEKQIVGKVTGESQYYMKGTSSSEGRRQSRSVQAGSDKKIQTGKKLDSCSGGKKKTSSSRSSKSLKKNLSFKRSYSRTGDVNAHAHRATCSSFLKNSKLLTSPDVVKLCPYKYCSLNARLRLWFPPLRSLTSAMGRSLKSRTSVKLSGEVGFADIYVDEKHENGSTREAKIQEIDFEAKNMGVECGEGEGNDKREDGLGSESAEMVSLQEGECIKSKEVSCNEDLEILAEAELCGSGNVNIRMMMDSFAILEQSENASEDLETEEGIFSANSIGILLPEQRIIQDIIVHCLLGNAQDEKLASKKAEDREEADGEKAGEQSKPVSKTEETLFSLAQKPCNQEQCNENWREFNPREPKYLPVFEEPCNEKVKLKHQDMYDRKNPEEWMTDYALQKAISKLALKRKKNVALLVEAFETVSPRKPSLAFTYDGHLQACN